MSITTILTLLIIIAVCVLPFIIMNVRYKKEEKKFMQVLFDHAVRNGMSISQHDILGNQVIGLSETGNAVLYLKRRNNDDQILQVDLAQIERCYVNKPTRSSVDGTFILTAGPWKYCVEKNSM